MGRLSRDRGYGAVHGRSDPGTSGKRATRVPAGCGGDRPWSPRLRGTGENVPASRNNFPKIHDVTTDTEDPPAFVAILGLRKDAPNPSTYGGPEIAAQQRAAYPDIRPLVSEIPPARAFERALSVARRMGWDIVDENPPEGRIEATATTLWFGFKDDVVIRIIPLAGTGSRLDIRSVSRVGLSDIGTNARRIRAFLKMFLEESKAG